MYLAARVYVDLPRPPRFHVRRSGPVNLPENSRSRIRRSINSEISLYRCKWDTLKLNYARDRLLINESKRPGTGEGGEGGGVCKSALLIARGLVYPGIIAKQLTAETINGHRDLNFSHAGDIHFSPRKCTRLGPACGTF
jgi:hypothetical protein